MVNQEYRDYLKSEDWRDRRKDFMADSNWECGMCGEKAVEVHHLKYCNLGFEVLGDDVICLCKNCHNEIHSNKENEEYGDYGEGY